MYVDLLLLGKVWVDLGGFRSVGVFIVGNFGVGEWWLEGCVNGVFWLEVWCILISGKFYGFWLFFLGVFGFIGGFRKVWGVSL